MDTRCRIAGYHKNLETVRDLGNNACAKYIPTMAAISPVKFK